MACALRVGSNIWDPELSSTIGIKIQIQGFEVEE